MRKIYISFIAAIFAMSFTTAAAGAAANTDYTIVAEPVDNAMFDEEDVMYDEEEDFMEDNESETSVPDESGNTASSEPYIYPDFIEGRGIGGNGTELVLEKYYGKFGYPEYISYACNTAAECVEGVDENGDPATLWFSVVGLTENTPENRQAVLDIAAENCYITFVEAKWSYNERKAVYDELSAMDIEGMSVAMPLNTENIFVYLPDDSRYSDDIPLYDGMVMLCEMAECVDDDYDMGGTITTGFGGENGIDGIPEIGTDESSSGLPMWAWFGIAFIAFIAVGGAIVLIRRNIVSANPDGSAEITAAAGKDIVKAIADTTEKPSAGLKDKIMRDSDK